MSKAEELFCLYAKFTQTLFASKTKVNRVKKWSVLTPNMVCILSDNSQIQVASMTWSCVFVGDVMGVPSTRAPNLTPLEQLIIKWSLLTSVIMRLKSSQLSRLHLLVRLVAPLFSVLNSSVNVFLKCQPPKEHSKQLINVFDTLTHLLGASDFPFYGMSKCFVLGSFSLIPKVAP